MSRYNTLLANVKVDICVCTDVALQGGSSAGRALLSRHASAARRVQRVYAGIAVLTCTLWLLMTLVHYVRTRTVEFPFWLPAVADEPLPLVLLPDVVSRRLCYNQVSCRLQFHSRAGVLILRHYTGWPCQHDDGRFCGLSSRPVHSATPDFKVIGKTNDKPTVKVGSYIDMIPIV